MIKIMNMPWVRTASAQCKNLKNECGEKILVKVIEIRLTGGCRCDRSNVQG